MLGFRTNQPGYPPQGPPPAYGMNPPPVMAQPPPPGTVVYVNAQSRGAFGLPAHQQWSGQGHQQTQYIGPPVGVAPVAGQTIMIVGGATGLGPSPSNIQCPSCHHSMLALRCNTVLHRLLQKHEPLLSKLRCCPCALIPYCTDSCKNINHYCPSCGAFLGTHQN
uniref:LITAF domain-containing protein n=1 Tax=Timema monikensis TaxID=170555 RepID=A0A7R9EIS8_9NEOP|nr:unnamed protein product [Timema monikensis]